MPTPIQPHKSDDLAALRVAARRALESDERRQQEEEEERIKQAQASRVRAEQERKKQEAAEAARKQVAEQERKQEDEERKQAAAAKATAEEKRQEEVARAEQERTKNKQQTLDKERQNWQARVAVAETSKAIPPHNLPGAQASPEQSAPPPAPRRIQPPQVHERLATIKTFRDDAAHSVGTQKQTAAGIAIAHQERKIQEASNPQAASRVVMIPEKRSHAPVIILLVIVGVALGGAAGYWFLSQSHKLAQAPGASSTTPTQTSSQQQKSATGAPQYASIIPADTQTTISTDGKQPQEVLSALTSALGDTSSQGVHDVVLTNTASGALAELSLTSFLSLWAHTIPSMLAETLHPTYMVGSYVDGQGAHSFVVLTGDSFSLSVAGMLNWEESLASDLANLDPNAAQTASSTFHDIQGAPSGAEMRAAGNPYSLTYIATAGNRIIITDTPQTALALASKK